MFFFSRDNYAVKEGDAIEVAILRYDCSRSASIRVATSSMTAKENDYIPIDKILFFAVNENYKSVEVFAKKDYLTEGDEFFTLQLLAVEANTIGYPSIATIKIIDMPMPDSDNS